MRGCVRCKNAGWGQQDRDDGQPRMQKPTVPLDRVSAADHHASVDEPSYCRMRRFKVAAPNAGCASTAGVGHTALVTP